jgi:hypothetical protein
VRCSLTLADTTTQKSGLKKKAREGKKRKAGDDEGFTCHGEEHLNESESNAET